MVKKIVNNSTIKLNVHTIQAVMRARLQNYLRYHVAMLLLDKKRSGCVLLADYIPTVSQKFQVKPKTVINNLYKLQEAGWGKFGGDYFYYKSIDKLPLNIVNPSTLAVRVDWTRLLTIDSWRAFCYQTTLVNKKGYKTVSRATLHDITGHSNKTQIKYEKRVGVDKRFNFGILGRYGGNQTKLENVYYTESDKTKKCIRVFLGNVATKTAKGKTNYQSYFMRQVSNTYFTELQMGKRRYNKPDENCGSNLCNYSTNYNESNKGNGCKRTYFEQGKKVQGVGREYKQHRLYDSLWFSYDDGVKTC